MKIVKKICFLTCVIWTNKKLPTKRHLIEYLLFVRHNGTPKLIKNQTLEVYVNDVAQEITKPWQRTKIPLLGRTGIRKLIVRVVKSYNKTIEIN